MQLQKQFSDDLVVITLNVDFDGEGVPSQEILDRISQILTDQNVACINCVATIPMEDVLSEFEFFGLPAAVLYGRAGNAIRKFDGEVDIERVVVPEIKGNL